MEKEHVEKDNTRYLTVAILIAAMGMCLYGVVSGETEIILMKAVNICMECIGLG